MGLASQQEVDKVVLEAKKQLTVEEIKDAVRKCSYGGKPVDMSLKGGEPFGKTNT